ncbi:MAG: cytochrome c oxidase assembly protein [Acidimicrobiia bacterium]|nr:cytochrome c oxidase assembly protein [Acidimicrobiia bacterium]
MTLGVGGALPSWHTHVDVWLITLVLGAGYWLAVRRIGPRFAETNTRGAGTLRRSESGPERPGAVGAESGKAETGAPVVTRFQAVCFGLGVVTVWLASSWPIHDVAETSMYSVHMVQHLLLAMVAAPLLLLGTPAWLARWLLRPPSALFRTVRALSRFFPAIAVFNVVLVVTHWPAVVDGSLNSHPLHFVLHAAIFVASLIIWMPVLSPLPEIPRLAPPMRAVFLFLQSIVPTVPASFLTFGGKPLYEFYVGKPHLWGLSTLEDQQTAGLIMKLGAGMLLWALIAVIFFRWAADEDGRGRPQRIRRALDRELEQIQAEAADEGVRQ